MGKSIVELTTARPPSAEPSTTTPSALPILWPPRPRPSQCGDHLDLLLPKEGNCSAYIHCHHAGRQEEEACKPGEFFNYEDQLCDNRPERADCAVVKPNESELAVDPVPPRQVLLKPVLPHPPPRECGPDTTHVLLPDPDDCNAFIKCLPDSRSSTRIQCNPWLLFNYEKQMCDLKDNVTCVRAAAAKGTTASLRDNGAIPIPKPQTVQAGLNFVD